MIIFNTDLDNTMIYSYKHDIGEDKLCAEVYRNRDISFVTAETARLLKKVNDSVLLVPTTTRTQEQYARIDLGIGIPKYALVCNGGVLLVNGTEDEAWYEESLASVANCREQLALAEEILERDENRSFEIRNIRGLFVFTKSEEPERSVESLRLRLDPERVDVFNNGVKVYAVPKALSKGIAVERLRKKLGAQLVIAAGDSEFDVSMLNSCDVPIAPSELAKIAELPQNTVLVDSGIFSEAVLNKVLETAAAVSTEYSSN